MPPFGHRPRLPVIVDTLVTAHSSVYAGGGADDAEVLVAVPELVRAAGATVADIRGPSGSPSSSAASPPRGASLWPTADVALAMPAGHDAAAAPEGGLAAADAGAAAALPLPWQPGQVDVELQGVIAHSRKIARLLLFANLVPLEAALQAAGAAAPSVKVGA